MTDNHIEVGDISELSLELVDTADLELQRAAFILSDALDDPARRRQVVALCGPEWLDLTGRLRDAETSR
jgi:hypothetical protein